MNEHIDTVSPVMSGDAFSHLTALEIIGEYQGENVWRCRCDCGGEKKVLEGRLLDGSVPDCGCRSRRRRKHLDLTGQRFGYLTAERYEFDNHRNQACWKFRCDCGKEKILPVASVRYNGVRSCGCLRAETTRQLNVRDISGQRFGRLTARRPTEKRDATGSVLWECRCDCGNVCLASAGNLRKGKIKSCGCYYRETRSQCDQYRRDKVGETNLSQLVSAKTPRSDNHSGSTGVARIEKTGKWVAYISFQKKRYYLGVFSSREEASKARKRAEEQIHDPVIRGNLTLLTEYSRAKYNQYAESGV